MFVDLLALKWRNTVREGGTSPESNRDRETATGKGYEAVREVYLVYDSGLFRRTQLQLQMEAEDGQLHTPTNILILSLAVSDLIVGLLLLPVEIILQLSCWFLGDLACSLFNYMSFIVTSASVGNMVLISMDRYVSICDPLHYTARVTVNRVRLCVCLCWLGSVSYSGIFARDGLSQPGKYNSCHGECVVFIDYVSGTVDLVLTCVLPVTVIIVLYVRVFSVAATQARAMRSQVGAHRLAAGSKTMRSELKAARTLGLVVVCNSTCLDLLHIPPSAGVRPAADQNPAV
ncbi:Trace amine-associated receptor 5 [Liparis tanakae]|uniref:Trace amine-associated receptor 5 n=1 Tax=Liparis tanakae TaxID=230148 RepID=A0A4Z2I9J5_9TELE|nr:Trace amine-associated receptor 5 [Liparis tanakae]